MRDAKKKMLLRCVREGKSVRTDTCFRFASLKFL